MKPYIIILSLLAVGFLAACSDDNEEARTPVISYQVNKTSLKVNETMEIVFNGVADQVVVFTGDNMHEFEKRSQSNTGFVMNKGVLTYSYSVPGTFVVTLIASTYDTYLGKNQQVVTQSFEVTVIDDNTTIESISSTITLNTYIAQVIDERDWLMCLPKMQVNSANGKEIALNPARQRLTIAVGSDSTKVFVNGAAYKSSNYYNLAQVNDIQVVANSGATRDYRLIGLIYPELEAAAYDGQPLTQVRNAFYQDMLTYVYPADADVTNVPLTFNAEEGVAFLRNGVEVKSGTVLNLTDGATYTLVRTSADNPLAKAVTRVFFQPAD